MNTLRKPRKQKTWPETICVLTVSRDRGGNPVNWGWSECGDGPVNIYYSDMSEDGLGKLHYIMDEAVTPSHGTLIVVDDAYSTLTGVGMWSQIKSGRWSLKGTDERRPSAPRCIVEDPPTIIHYGVSGRAGYAVICDTANWGWQMPEEHAWCGVVREKFADLPKYVTNCLMVKVMSIRNFVAEYDRLIKDGMLGDSWRMTSGSQAFYGFRQNYMNSPIEASRCDESESLVERSSYGGRCECFFLGEVQGPIYQYDVNQLYSFAAMSCPVPVEFIGDITGYAMARSPSGMWDMAADVQIETSVPIYPYRAAGEHGDRGNPLVIYPVGNFRTFLAGPELQLAAECGHIKEIYFASEYRTEKVLKEWALRMWSLRGKSEGAMKKVVKGISLSLYGKFGQRLREWSPDADEIPPGDMDVGDWYTAGRDGGVNRHRVLCGQCATEITGGYVGQSSPPISAWINSFGRLHLQRLINEAGGCYYCDTDSLWVDREGHLALQGSQWVGTELGQLRLVQDWERVDFRGIKHYVAEGELSHAGIPDKAEVIGEGRYMWQEDCSFGGHMNSREWPSKRIVVRSYRGQSLYRHGIVNSDGSVSPHFLR